MPSKSLGKTLLRGAARLTEPLAKHELAKRVARGDEDPERITERQGQTQISRPSGTMIWCHVKGLDGALKLNGFIQAIQVEMPEIGFLVTSTDRLDDAVFTIRLPQGVFHQYAPFDKPAAVERFLTHWKPDICVWADDALMPVLNAEVERLKIPAVLVNLTDIDRANPQFRWFPSVAKATLGGFRSVLVATPEAQADLKSFGVLSELSGPFSEETIALEHDEVRRAQLARQLDGRPVWLAAKVSTSEIKDVLQAHKNAARMSQGLVVIVVPNIPDDISVVERFCQEMNLVWKNSQDLEGLDARVDVIVARGADGLGLWYQMAAVCFMGCSLSNDGGHSPFDAAALGSAVIHGPHVDNFADAYLRLRAAGAAIEVVSVASLAEAVEELNVPDKAAEMAHGGWLVCSEGAQATDRLVDVVWDLLPMGAPL